jgi:hypothetical protein
MDKTRSNIYLISTVFLLIIINLTLIVKIDVANLQGKRFTYEDGVLLYNICQKHGGSKDTLIKRVYEDKNTDFREFILGK